MQERAPKCAAAAAAMDRRVAAESAAAASAPLLGKPKGPGKQF